MQCPVVGHALLLVGKSQRKSSNNGRVRSNGVAGMWDDTDRLLEAAQLIEGWGNGLAKTSTFWPTGSFRYGTDVDRLQSESIHHQLWFHSLGVAI